ncbi:MGH1-like glycoside hydrolase domain-containing protein [Parachlamydia acanthamoebae]|uniref:MGH1-like glycoside hydrolase domain-containing protein n=1 Tax=Parachlamydia acanthamoebae TaxID=83552 RepID=UPI0024E26D53|nr:glucosidase [Parachlamydia acanthamoebae]
MENIESTEEGKRLSDIRLNQASWRKWGPYLSERQWGTVREDYSPQGTAWEYLPHDQARSRAYRWGEDGLAGISDEKQQLCFALALWNGQDSILKERLFGVSGPEGNHGEDVKEYYFYLDNLPSHAYMKHLYKYPQKAFPYDELVSVNKQRTREQPEYELLDTGIFDDNRYFDVFTEYAKVSSEDLLIQFTVANRGPESAVLYLLPTLWFRNTWSWDTNNAKPVISLTKEKHVLKASHIGLGDYWLYCDTPDAVYFTENETNQEKLFQIPNKSSYTKDGMNEFLIHGSQNSINGEKGTKATISYRLDVTAGETKVIKLRLTNRDNLANPFAAEFDQIFAQRKVEADAFYLSVTPYPLSKDMRNVERQAFAGLLWNKQCYHYNVKKWLEGDPSQPKPPQERLKGRNYHWPYLDAYDIFSMPDKWEYPWFAAWDLGFHTISLAMIDPEFAKEQLLLLTREWYMAPDGQIPAYEWKFSDVNPPVQAWAAMRVYQIESTMYGRKDRNFLERIFHKLLLNFGWWVNRKDTAGRNIFEGGFLGLDNIGAFDRSLTCPDGGYLEQPDATGWMGMYCLNCLQIALELADEDPVYEDIATKFFEHFVCIADAINNVTGEVDGLWDTENGFYYGLMIKADGEKVNMSQDNMTGIIPLFVVATNNADVPSKFPNYRRRFVWFVENQAERLHNIADLRKRGQHERILLAFTNQIKLTRVLEKVLDEEQFLSPNGIRSVSKRLKDQPFTVFLNGKAFKLDYEPAESTTPIFGGNSNWRGPVWFPLNFLLIESLQKFHYYYDDHLKIECPTGSGQMRNLWEVSLDISKRLIDIFLEDQNGRRPVYGNIEKFQTDPHWKDYILFHEYFHGDTGKGLGASNQTGWTSLVAKLIHQYGKFVAQGISPDKLSEEKIWSL